MVGGGGSILLSENRIARSLSPKTITLRPSIASCLGVLPTVITQYHRVPPYVYTVPRKRSFFYFCAIKLTIILISKVVFLHRHSDGFCACILDVCVARGERDGGDAMAAAFHPPPPRRRRPVVLLLLIVLVIDGVGIAPPLSSYRPLLIVPVLGCCVHPLVLLLLQLVVVCRTPLLSHLRFSATF